jgi:glycosyltransferase involved in cell wall biosynthesis
MKIRFLKPDNSLCHNARSPENCSECYKQLNLPSRMTGFSTTVRYLKGLLGVRGYTGYVSTKVSQYDHYQNILESADALIVLARAWQGFFRSGQTLAIPYGIDGDMFRPVPGEPFRQRYNIEGPYVLVTSRIHNTKGQDWAIRAMVHLPEEIKLVLAGNSSLFTGAKFEDNEHRRNAGRVIEELGLRDRIVFTGFLGTEELVQAYSGALATLVPSVWLEPFGYVTAEAMACECPVVITGNCGSAELVDDGIQGYVVPRMDPRAMAEAALRILPRRKEMGKAARDRMVQDLNWPKITGDVLQVMEKVKH